MSRFAYIPLNFDKITEGTEREISIKRDSKDLYVLNDYKVPVSMTSKLREEIIGKDTIAKNLYEDILNIEAHYKSCVIRISNLGFEIDDLIEKTENDLFDRITSLESYKEYLKQRYQQIYESFQDIKKLLEDTLNSYKENISAFLEMLKIKYNKAKLKYDEYVKLEQNYLNKIITMENEITELKRLLALKLNKLGTGSGSFEGEKDTTVTKTETFTGWFYWMSNNPTTYPGDDYRGYYFSVSPPDIPRDFVGGVYDLNPISKWGARIISKPADMTAEQAVNFFKTGSRLVSIYWYYNYVEGKGYISHTGLYNQYGKRCAMTYAKERTVGGKEEFHYVVT